MDSVMITGYTGLIGKEVLRLLKTEYCCYCLGRNALSRDKSYIQQDLSKEFCDKDFPDRVDYIIHLAQAENYANFPNSAKEVFDINVGGMLRLLEFARTHGTKKIVIASSGGVYGNGIKCENESIDFYVNDINYYQSTKLMMEILANSYKQFFDIVILRPFFVYGEGQNKNMLFSRLIDKIKANECVIIGSPDDIRINPIHARDAALCFVNALKKSCSGIYNVAGNQEITLGQVAKMIGEYMGKKAVIRYENLGGRDILADNARMVRDLHNPEVSISQGLSEMVEACI